MKRRNVVVAIVAILAALASWLAPAVLAAELAAEPKADFSLDLVNADAQRLALHNADLLLLRADVGTIQYKGWGAGQERFKLAKAPVGVDGAGERVYSEAALKSATQGWLWDDQKQTLDVKRSAGDGKSAVVVRL
jgi:hypothetical protein